MTAAIIVDGPAAADWTLILAHGAGAPMDTPLMTRLAHGLGDSGIRVIRFEFEYMARRRQDGKKRPPDAASKLLARFREAIGNADWASRVALGGKSMGGRMATLLAAEGHGEAAIVFGYPFHPPGKPDRLRLDHFPGIACPVLICQGERDRFGTADEVAGYTLPAGIHLHWAPDGDHDLKPRKASGHSHDGHLDAAVTAAARFLTAL